MLSKTQYSLKNTVVLEGGLFQNVILKQPE